MCSPILYNYNVCDREVPLYYRCMPNAAFLCERGELRLAQQTGGKDYEGLVEICIDEAWHKVCADSSWGNEEATVTCRELGYSSGGESRETALSIENIRFSRMTLNHVIATTIF